jgi:hypothetical protein
MFPKKILTFHGKIYTENASVAAWRFGLHDPKGNWPNLNPKFQMYNLNKETTNSRDHLCSSNLEIGISCITVIS